MRWSIVLSGGEGTRIRKAIQRWFGRKVPKQYCTFVGTRSMLEHTCDRAASLVGSQRTVTVISQGHRRFINGDKHKGRLLEQPVSRGTAPGIFLPATYINAEDRDATLLIFPSDHFIYPETNFLVQVERAAWLAETYGDQLVILAAVPDRPETDYGWIQPGENCPHPLRIPGVCGKRVREFHEKPSLFLARRWLQADYLWNTLIMAVKVECLMSIGFEIAPEMMRRFQILSHILNGVGSKMVRIEDDQILLSKILSDLPAIDFSRSFLTRMTGSSIVAPLEDVQWCDWGRPERVVSSIRRMGKTPVFEDTAVGAEH